MMRQFDAFRPMRFVMVLAPLVSLGCRTEMYDQPRYEPFEANSFFADGASSRPILVGTVATLPPSGRGSITDAERERLEDPAGFEHFYEGKVAGDLATTFPFEIQKSDLLRGQQQYTVFCYPCHGAAGDGKGMIVQRGFPPPPPFYGQRPRANYDQAQTLYDDLRSAPVGHFYDVITNGRGVMYSYKSRIDPADRWRITAYIRALQLSQYASVEELPAEMINRIEGSSAEEQGLLEGPIQ